MASIRRAQGYVKYLIAIAISALFAWVGRPAPGWAQDLQVNYNAKVFRNAYLNSDNNVWSSITTVRPSGAWPSQGMEIGKIAPAWPSQGMEIGKIAPAWPSQGMEIGKIAPAWPSQGMEIGKIAPAWPSQGMEIGKLSSPEVMHLGLNPQVLSKFEAIQLKLQNNEATTENEDALFLSVQNAAKLNELSVQVKKIDELSNQVNTLLLKLNQSNTPTE